MTWGTRAGLAAVGFAATATACVLLGACARHAGRPAEARELSVGLDRLTPPEWELIRHSRAYQRLLTAVHCPIVMIEWREGDEADIYLGEDMPDHVVRSDTLRLNARKGTVERQDYDAAGEIIWVDDDVRHEVDR